MATSTDDSNMKSRAAKLLAAGAEAELQLLRSERKAEKRLAEAKAMLASDEARLLRGSAAARSQPPNRRRGEATLREVQERRAAGPTRDRLSRAPIARG